MRRLLTLGLLIPACASAGDAPPPPDHGLAQPVAWGDLDGFRISAAIDEVAFELPVFEETPEAVRRSVDLALADGQIQILAIGRKSDRGTELSTLAFRHLPPQDLEPLQARRRLADGQPGARHGQARAALARFRVGQVDAVVGRRHEPRRLVGVDVSGEAGGDHGVEEGARGGARGLAQGQPRDHGASGTFWPVSSTAT